jgi:hypothetical protein
MQQGPAGTGAQKPDHELPAFIDKGTTRSYKETFNAVMLLRAGRPRPTAGSPARRVTTGVLLLGTTYLSAHFGPVAVSHLLSLI